MLISTMLHTLRIPTKEQYAYIEVQYEGTSEQAYAEYLRLTGLVQNGVSGFEKIKTFTGELVRYNAVDHIYTDMKGNRLMSGSTYKKSLEKPFDLDRIAPLTAKKHGVEEAHIRDMWKRNGEISSGLGTSLHQAMEQFFKHRENGTEKNYHLPKHPFLRKAVESFPLREATEAHPEIMVSDVKQLRVGQIDLLVVDEPMTGRIIDYKSDAEIEKHINDHFNQLSWYAAILKAHGWNITGLEVWNYTDDWVCLHSPVLELRGKLVQGGAGGTA